MKQSPVRSAARVLAYRLACDSRSGIWCKMYSLGTCILVLVSACKGNRDYLGMGISAKHVNSGVFHCQLASQVAINPLDNCVFICICPLGHKVVYILAPVLNSSVSYLGTFLCDNLHNGRVKRLCGVNWGCASFDIMHFSPFVCDNQRPFKLPDIFGVYSKVGLQRHVDLDRKSTRLNSSHVAISYAVFCLKKKKK